MSSLNIGSGNAMTMWCSITPPIDPFRNTYSYLADVFPSILELILNSSPSRIVHRLRCKLLRVETLPWASYLAMAAASEEKWKCNLSLLLTFCFIDKKLDRVLLYSFMLTMLPLKFNGQSAVFYPLTNEKCSISMRWIVVLSFHLSLNLVTKQ